MAVKPGECVVRKAKYLTDAIEEMVVAIINNWSGDGTQTDVDLCKGAVVELLGRQMAASSSTRISSLWRSEEQKDFNLDTVLNSE